jgi:molybdate transport repressor ModE-like protein
MADYRKRIGRQDSCCRCHRAVVDHGVRKEDEHVLSALLIDELNGMFEADLVETRPGGRGGGNARLSALGRAVVRLCRALENGGQLVAPDEGTHQADASRNKENAAAKAQGGVTFKLQTGGSARAATLQTEPSSTGRVEKN